MRSLLLALVVAIGFAVTPAAAATQMVRAQDPQSVVKAMRDAGYQAELTVDGRGDPMIKSKTGDTNWVVFFYNCTNNRDCATVTFHSGYNTSTSPGLDLINRWNSSQRFGRAYLDDEGDPIIEMDVDLDDGGLSPLLFIDNIEFWTSVITGFEKHIGWD